MIIDVCCCSAERRGWLSPVVTYVAYGYLLIGNLDSITSPELDTRSAPDFAEVVTEGLIHVQAATHTGDVLLDVTILDGMTDRRTGRGAAADTLLLPLLSPTIVVSTFWGLVEGCEVELPEQWTAARVRITSPRYAEVAAREREYLPGPHADPEEILVEFAPG
ncbi:hypothetical protein ACQPZA_11450 [Pseudonocardia xinjiangensis]|uniref:hypothetical protein n=1 Tax=Pseudonocardia xinjiangensis TaxID=75289 RepID=UPI003D8C8AC3